MGPVSLGLIQHLINPRLTDPISQSREAHLTAMTLKTNGVTWLRRTVLPQGSLDPDGACPRAPSIVPDACLDHFSRYGA